VSTSLKWLSAVRVLLVIYALALVLAWWETGAVQRGEPRTKNAVLDYPDVTAKYADISRQLYPDSMSARFWSGYAAFQQGRFEEACADFEAALKDNPKDRTLLYAYAVALATLDENSPETAAAIDALQWNYPDSALQDPKQVARNLRNPAQQPQPAGGY
jgi:tetratricopeptide (TPR) repeat protein